MRVSSSVFGFFTASVLLFISSPATLLVNGQTTLRYCDGCPLPHPQPSARISDIDLSAYDTGAKFHALDDGLELRLDRIRDSFAQLDAGLARAYDGMAVVRHRLR